MGGQLGAKVLTGGDVPSPLGATTDNTYNYIIILIVMCMFKVGY